MRTRITLQRDRSSVEVERFACSNELCGQGTGWGWRKSEVPILNASTNGKVFPCVLVRRDFRADRMQPFVAVGVVEMPMRINQVLDRIVTKTRQGFCYLR